MLHSSDHPESTLVSTGMGEIEPSGSRTTTSVLPDGTIMMSVDGGTSATAGTPSHLAVPVNSKQQAISREEVRRARQMELDTQMRTAEQELANIGTSKQSVVAPNAKEAVTARSNEEDLREQIRMLTEEIEYLRSQQHSDWILGLSDEPPAYSVVRTPTIRR
jgi:hypothetical protein